MNPRDLYFKIESDDAALAARFKPYLQFDSSEKWRPLNVDAFFAEGVHTVCPSGADPCQPVTSSAQLTTTALNLPSARVNVQGANSSTDQESDYQTPLAECRSSSSQLYDCNGDESLAAANASRIYWTVVPPSTTTSASFAVRKDRVVPKR